MRARSIGVTPKTSQVRRRSKRTNRLDLAHSAAVFCLTDPLRSHMPRDAWRHHHEQHGGGARRGSREEAC
jgi:hypothetical protein